MKTLALTQGSGPWHAHRAAARNASDASAVLGCSPYMSRAQLLQIRHTGLRPEVDPGTQRRFDDGHSIEAAQKPGAEDVIGEPLYPVVGCELVHGIELSASFDGLTMDESTAYECKSLNDELRACLNAVGGIEANDARALPKHYRVQMEQQLMVCAGERVLFVAADLAGNDVRRCWYGPDPALRAEILAAWRQFDADLAAYAPTQAAPAAVAAPVESLPAVMVQMTGALAITSNLDAFGAALRAFIEKIPSRPSTDQEFADTDAACKALKKAEEALAAEEARALASMADVESMRRLVSDLSRLAKSTRLAREKMVEARKLEIRTEEVLRGKKAMADHVAGLNARLGKPYMPPIDADFAGAIKGLRSLDSVRNAVDGEIARIKIESNRIADAIDLNLRYLREHANDHRFLFSDVAQIVLKPADDLQTLVRARIAEHRAAEQKRLEAEREKIRKEEEAKAERVQVNLNNLKAYRPSDAESSSWHQERIQALKAEPMTEAIYGGRLEEAKRIQAQLVDDLVDSCQAASDSEAAARQSAPAASTAQPPAAAPIAQPASVSQAANVVPMGTRAPAAPASPPTLRLGVINERIAPLQISAEGLATLGFKAAGKERSAVLYHEHQFEGICEAIERHIGNVRERHARQAA